MQVNLDDILLNLFPLLPLPPEQCQQYAETSRGEDARESPGAHRGQASVQMCQNLVQDV